MESIRLKNVQSSVLALLGNSVGGFCTRDLAPLIGRQPGHESNRKHSALIHKACAQLEGHGRIKRLDNEKPVAWTKA